MNASLSKSAVSVSLFVVLISFFHGCKTAEEIRNERCQVALDKAEEYKRKNDNENALKVLFEAVSPSKPKPETFSNEIQIHYKRNQEAFKEEIIKQMNKHKVSFSYPRAYLEIAEIYRSEKNYTEAIKYIDTAVYINHEFGQAWEELMNIYMTIGDFKKAKETGTFILSDSTINPVKNIKASILTNLATIAIQENDREMAVKYYLESLSNNPKSHNVWIDVLDKYIENKDFANAKEICNRFLSGYTLDSYNEAKATFLMYLAKIASLENDLDNAEKYYTESLKLNYRQSVRQELNEVLDKKRK